VLTYEHRSADSRSFGLVESGLVVGTVKEIVSVYSSGAIGRLVPEDVTGLVRYVRQHAAAAS